MKKALFSLIIIALTSLGAMAQTGSLEVGRNAHYEVTFDTSVGRFTVKLLNQTPQHRDNFVKLAQSEFYRGVLFHRVIDGFMIQAGDPSSRENSQVKTYGQDDAGYKIAAEIVPGLFHKKGMLAAARDSDAANPERKSSSSQFYIVVGKTFNDQEIDAYKKEAQEKGWEALTPEKEAAYRSVGGTPHLDGRYTIFGEVVGGQKTVDLISKLPTYSNDRPKDDVYIKNVTVKLVRDVK